MATAATSHFPTLTLKHQVDASAGAVRHALACFEYLERHPNDIAISQQGPEIIRALHSAVVRMEDAVKRADPDGYAQRAVAAGRGEVA